MKVDWDFTAQTYLDQLSPQEQAKVLLAVKRLESDSPQVEQSHVTKLAAASHGENGNLYSLRVGNDLRVLFRRLGKAVTILDVVRRSQIDRLRQLRRPA
jgi:mRNA-degrading endonuclease RelE of RelBE toxin-antitoxin system